MPFPPDRGDKIRSHHVLKRLAELAPVHVATFGDTDDDMAQDDSLAQVAASHCLLRRGKPLWRAQLREKPLHTIFTDEDHIVRWAWRTRNKYRAQHGALADLAPGTPLIRLRTAREVAAWLDTL